MPLLPVKLIAPTTHAKDDGDQRGWETALLCCTVGNIASCLEHS